MGIQNPDNNFSLKRKWDSTQIDFVNLTDSPVTIDIFNTVTLSNFPTTLIPHTFSIISPYNYNALLQDVNNNPMLIRRIELITKTQAQLTQPFNITTRDANGLQVLIPRFPNVELSVNQVQPNIAYLDFKERELILSGNNLFSQYTFPKLSDTRMIIYYFQLNRIDIFTHGVTQCGELEDYLRFKDMYVSEAELRKVTNEPVLIEAVEIEKKKQRRLATKMKILDKINSNKK